MRSRMCTRSSRSSAGNENGTNGDSGDDNDSMNSVEMPDSLPIMFSNPCRSKLDFTNKEGLNP
jgi:hypothetical protein